MQQVLFRIPIHTNWTPDGIPIYGYGMMLFLAFVACTWLATRLARRQGIAPEHVQDLAIYLFVGGVIGSRVAFMLQYDRGWLAFPNDWADFLDKCKRFFYIWEGGLVFYGGMVGGAVAYVVAYYAVIKKHHLSTLQLADVIAPCAALGLCLGRVGCLLNGCCYGEVACESCPRLAFPFSGMPRQQLVESGFQTAAGFTTAAEIPDGPVVGAVEPGSAADRAGLKAGDVILKVDGRDTDSELGLWAALSPGEWPRGKNDLTLTVGRDKETLDLTFAPKTLALHPTQLYESISMALLLFLLLAYFPFRRHDGELFALFLMLYPLHRFLDEMLRLDTLDWVSHGLTLSQHGSILLFAVGLVFFLWLRRLPAQYQPAVA